MGVFKINGDDEFTIKWGIFKLSMLVMFVVYFSTKGRWGNHHLFSNF